MERDPKSLVCSFFFQRNLARWSCPDLLLPSVSNRKFCWFGRFGGASEEEEQEKKITLLGSYVVDVFEAHMILHGQDFRIF